MYIVKQYQIENLKNKDLSEDELMRLFESADRYPSDFVFCNTNKEVGDCLDVMTYKCKGYYKFAICEEIEKIEIKNTLNDEVVELFNLDDLQNFLKIKGPEPFELWINDSYII